MTDHVAIMRRSWKLIPKILDGRKKIESRWSKFKIAPWGKVKKGDRIYFKNSGEPVTIVSEASKIMEFDELTSKKVKQIFKEFGGERGIGMSNINSSYAWAKDKKYCTLIFLKNPKKIKPFSINKVGFGTGAAWLVVGDIKKVKV